MIFMIGAEKNKKEMKEVIVKINKTKSWFFEKISKTNKPLARLIKNKREKNQINKIRNEKSRGYNRQHRHTKDHKTITSNYMPIRGFPGNSDGTEAACNVEDLGLIPG